MIVIVVMEVSFSLRELRMLRETTRRCFTTTSTKTTPPRDDTVLYKEGNIVRPLAFKEFNSQMVIFSRVSLTPGI